MNYSDFETKVLKRHGDKHFKVTNSWGVYDAYKHIRKNGWYNIGRPLKEKEFYDIIGKINSEIATLLSFGATIKLPAKMGKFELRKHKREVRIEDGKVKITYPIDWHKTLKLWYDDEEARKNKTLIRSEEKEVFRIKYDAYRADFQNRCFYEFSLNRNIKKALKENIKKGMVDTLW